jgi:3-deoxy-manno-octulosonate cytidylyltransferase (CMP-KDO synthetase)
MDMKPPTEAWGIIPARYQSSRFPGKPLADIHGKPMFWHVWQRAARCPELSGVYLATDDQRIASAAQELSIPVVMTRHDHPSGTDRVLEAATLLKLDEHAIVINIQGDEPMLEPDLLTRLVKPFADPQVMVTTPAVTITPAEAAGPDRVKVVFDATGRALYFSRTQIPFSRDNTPIDFFGHIGLYGFRMPALKQFVAMGSSRLENIEKLEQLRLLENGIPIHVVLTAHHSIGVDSPADLENVCRLLDKKHP